MAATTLPAPWTSRTCWRTASPQQCRWPPPGWDLDRRRRELQHLSQSLAGRCEVRLARSPGRLQLLPSAKARTSPTRVWLLPPRARTTSDEAATLSVVGERSRTRLSISQPPRLSLTSRWTSPCLEDTLPQRGEGRSPNHRDTSQGRRLRCGS